jgi:L-lactate dehydrogenase (cytochrome)
MAYIDQVRRIWEGKIILKGISAASHLEKLRGGAIDAFWVSMHGGRQFQGGRSSIDILRNIREKTDVPLIFDGGVMSGGDVIKSTQIGADLVFSGKAFHYALGAFGAKGAEIACQLFSRDIVAHMYQMGMDKKASLQSKVNNENFHGKDA